MNAERLHAICVALKYAIESTRLLEELKTVNSLLQNVVAQPQQPNHQQELAKHLDTFYSSLSNFPTESFSPAWRQSLYELGGTEILGNKLAERIRNILERNQIMPVAASQEILEILQHLQQFNTAIDDITKGFEYLGIGADELNAGECELGVLVPRDAVHNNIQEFGKELQDLNFIFGTFSELASGKRDTFKIKTISSSDLMVFLAAIPPVAACIAHATERIVKVYKTLLEIKKLKAELKQQGLKDEALKGITEYASSVMSDRIKELTMEIVDAYYEGNDSNRKNELTNAVRISLNRLANRIDRGFNIEVRAEPSEEPEEGDGEDDEKKKARMQIQTVIDASISLQFMKLQGGRILHLPEKATSTKTTKPKTEKK